MSDSYTSNFDHSYCRSSSDNPVRENSQLTQEGRISIRDVDSKGILLMSDSDKSSFDHDYCRSSSEYQMRENAQQSLEENILSGTTMDVTNESEVASLRVFQSDAEADRYFQSQSPAGNSFEFMYNVTVTNPMIISVLPELAFPNVSGGKTEVGAASAITKTYCSAETEKKDAAAFMSNKVTTSAFPSDITINSSKIFVDSLLIVCAENPRLEQIETTVDAGSSCSKNFEAQNLYGVDCGERLKDVLVNEEKRVDYNEIWQKWRNKEQHSKKKDFVKRKELLKCKTELENEGLNAKKNDKLMQVSSCGDFVAQGLFGSKSLKNSATKEVNREISMEYMEIYRKWKNGETLSVKKDLVIKNNFLAAKRPSEEKRLERKNEEKRAQEKNLTRFEDSLIS